MVDLEDRDYDDELVEDIGNHNSKMEEASSHHAPTPGKDTESRSVAGSVMRSQRDPRSNRRVTLLQFEETVGQINSTIAAENERCGVLETNILDIKQALADIDNYIRKQDDFVR